MMFQIIVQRRSRPEIENFLRSNSDAHIPPLSPRVDIAAFSGKIYDYAVQFWGFSDDKTVGFMACYFNDPGTIIGYITTISIKREFQGQGLGKMMTEAVKKYALDNGFRKIGLEVDSNNVNAIGLYQATGFKIVNKDEDSINMEISLKE